MDEFKTTINSVKEQIEASYEKGMTVSEAEVFATKLLGYMMQLSEAIRSADLDCRMRRAGLKAIRAAMYLEFAAKGDKKPSDVMLDHMINSNPLVQGEQERFDNAEVNKEEIERNFKIFELAHQHFKKMGQGAF